MQQKILITASQAVSSPTSISSSLTSRNKEFPRTLELRRLRDSKRPPSLESNNDVSAKRGLQYPKQRPFFWLSLSPCLLAQAAPAYFFYNLKDYLHACSKNGSKRLSACHCLATLCMNRFACCQRVAAAALAVLVCAIVNSNTLLCEAERLRARD